MAQRADVQSLEALVRLRGGIARFVEVVGSAVSDAASDVNRTMQWLELNRAHHWKMEERKRHDKHQQALEKLRMKKLFKGVAGERQSFVDEEKVVKVSLASLEEAQTKRRAVAMHRNKLMRESVMFQGALTRLGSIATQTGPMALAELGNLIVALEKYGKISAELVGSEGGEVGGVVQAGGVGMGRGGSAGEGAGGGAGGGAEGEVGVAAEEGKLILVDWKVVEQRAWKAWRDVGGKVVAEVGALEAARGGEGESGKGAVLLRDFLRGKIFVGLAEPVEGVGCLVVGGGVVELLGVVPGLEEVLGAPGDKRLRLMDGQVVEGKKRG